MTRIPTTHKKKWGSVRGFQPFRRRFGDICKGGERGQAHGSLWGNHLDHALQRLRVLSQSPASGQGRSGAWQRFWSLGQASNLSLQYVRPEKVFGRTWSFNSRKEGWFAYASESANRQCRSTVHR